MRRSNPMAGHLGSVTLTACLLFLSPGVPAADVGRVHLPGGSRPPILDRVELPPEVDALAVSADGNRAAVAAPLPASKVRDVAAEVRVYGIDGSVVVTPVEGRIRDLLFAGETLFGILHRPAKRHEGTASLVSFDLTARKARREMRLPPSARDLESWEGGRALLVTARNEIRTITLPLLRSGPLYRVPGENLSLALAGGTRVLIGQETDLLVVDLADPQDRESMPVRERLATPAAVVSLALTPDGGGGLARLADGRVLSLTLSPLTLEDVGHGVVVSPDLPEQPSPSPTLPPVSVPAPAPPPAARAPADEPVEQERPPVEAPSPEPPPELEPRPEPPPTEPAPSQPSVRQPSADAEPDAPWENAQLRGRLEGPAADRVVAVVALGPDNLLRQAARVEPGDDGRWTMRGLAPGRYRIQLDGGGGRAVVSQPPFRHVEVTAGGPIVVDFRVVRAF